MTNHPRSPRAVSSGYLRYQDEVLPKVELNEAMRLLRFWAEEPGDRSVAEIKNHREATRDFLKRVAR